MTKNPLLKSFLSLIPKKTYWLNSRRIKKGYSDLQEIVESGDESLSF
jgi:hypothetical protein